MTINVGLGKESYDIIIESGLLAHVKEHFNLKRKVLIVTDSGVPEKYSAAVASQCSEPFVYTIPMGEASKSFDNFRRILSFMLKKGFTRTDAVIAVGGGVCGDLAGFCASSYMRGIDFCNIPTTLLSQVDSSVGGKTAIDLDGVKNCVGSFYQPKTVLIDPDVLLTLDNRQFSAGLAESIKMAATFSDELFSLLEEGNFRKNANKIIEKSVEIKKDVVEKDERETGLRRVLNFGHTIGHAIESAENLRLLHGECVALGMIPMSSDKVKERLLPVLKLADLPTSINENADTITEIMSHDKKKDNDKISVVYCDEIGTYRVEKKDFGDFAAEIKEKIK